MHNVASHRRRSIRLKEYDYSQTGAYFVTVCTHNRACLFGAMLHGEMRLNASGRAAQKTWHELPRRFSDVNVDAFIVMPNHIHGVIFVGAQFIAPGAPHPYRLPAQEGAINRAPTLGEIIRAYKGVSARLIRQTSNPEFTWQRNYYEHVIRSEVSLTRIRQYILDNPARWEFDRENPGATDPERKDVWLV